MVSNRTNMNDDNRRNGEVSGGHELLLAWLKDAYAMERTLVAALENHARDAEKENKAEVARRIQQHVEETRSQADRVQMCIESLGGKTSGIKTGMAMTVGQIKELAQSAVTDEVMKNHLNDIATEHFEMACYQALATAAAELGEEDIERTCREIYREEEDMAQWLESRLIETTVATIQEYEASTTES